MEQTSERGSDRKESKELRNMTLVSLALLIFSAIVLWLSRRDPLLVVWRLSELLCLGSFFWTSFLTENTMRRSTAFHYNSYGLLLASAAHSALSPEIGVLAAHLSSHFAAGVVGYALADRRERQGAERAAHAVPIPEDVREITRLRFLKFIAGLTLAGPALALAGGAAWLAWHAAEFGAYELVWCALVGHTCAVLLGIVVVAMFQLRGALISLDQFAIVIGYVGFIAALSVVCPLVIGEVASTFATWIAVLLLTGLFGYCVRVHASFKQRLLEIRRGKAEASSSLLLLGSEAV